MVASTKYKAFAIARSSAAKGRDLVDKLAPARRPVHEIRNVLAESKWSEAWSESTQMDYSAYGWSETRRVHTQLSRVWHAATWHAMKQRAAFAAAKSNEGIGQLT
jgi:hypothetical protein